MHFSQLHAGPLAESKISIENFHLLLQFDLSSVMLKDVKQIMHSTSTQFKQICVELNANLNHDLNNVSQWLVKNKLQHHSTKTKLMYVGSNHNLAKIDNEFSVMINDQLFPECTQSRVWELNLMNH